MRFSAPRTSTRQSHGNASKPAPPGPTPATGKTRFSRHSSQAVGCPIATTGMIAPGGRNVRRRWRIWRCGWVTKEAWHPLSGALLRFIARSLLLRTGSPSTIRWSEVQFRNAGQSRSRQAGDGHIVAAPAGPGSLHKRAAARLAQRPFHRLKVILAPTPPF